MMTLDELTREQKIQIKQQMLVDTGESISWGELADADELVSDEELEEQYGGTVFSEDDFF